MGAAIKRLRETLNLVLRRELIPELAERFGLSQPTDEQAVVKLARRMTGIIDAMTHEERDLAERTLLASERVQRIASGAGVSTRDVVNFNEQMTFMARMMEPAPSDYVQLNRC